jgi:hypothetical protein
VSEADRFDARGFLVRLVFGRRPQVFQLPGIVKPKVWRFATGIAVRGPSLSEALDQANELANLKKNAGDTDDVFDEER